MMNWREITKIDAHVHILPDEVHAANPDADDAFSFAEVSAYQKIMDQYNICTAVALQQKRSAAEDHGKLF